MLIGSLFSGIGGLELGLEAAGFGPVIWQVENNEYCRAVLAKHWPNSDRSVIDVKAAKTLQRVDLICGGFPCQDVSGAGKKAGLFGERSGLWFEYHRIVRELRPTCVVVENVASGKRRWLPTVRRMLETLGYRTRAISISAADVGAPHLRRRIFVLAVANDYGSELREQPRRRSWESGQKETVDRCARSAMANTSRFRCIGRNVENAWSVQPAVERCREILADKKRRRTKSTAKCGVGGVLDGVSCRVDLPTWWPLGRGEKQDPKEPPRSIEKGKDKNRAKRIKALGNAVVPQCARVIGLILKEWLEQS